jgi:putative transposase
LVKKKVRGLNLSQKKKLIDQIPDGLSIRRQCELLELNRSNLYYEPVLISKETLNIMTLIDEIYTAYPFYGSRKITIALKQKGLSICRERVQKLMRQMAIEVIYPKPRLSIKDKQHTIYPYLLANYSIERPNQVWSSDITYIRLQQGFMYLVAIIDWYSRYVLSWRLSNALEASFCIEALEESLEKGTPYIFNSDQGSQFTCKDYTGVLLDNKVKISMDGKGRALDNVFVERLWRSVKYEDIYLKSYETVLELKNGLNKYFAFYNNKRYHQSLKYKTPKEVHYC